MYINLFRFHTSAFHRFLSNTPKWNDRYNWEIKSIERRKKERKKRRLLDDKESHYLL